MEILKEQTELLLQTLRERFEKNPHRHPEIKWSEIEQRISKNEKSLTALFKMEETGGEPDVLLVEKDPLKLIYVDFSKETPLHRRSYCYDQKALNDRKTYKPANSACGVAEEMGVKILNEPLYYQLQEIESVDLKTSSWLETPSEVREKGGALFGDQRFGRVFTYHNGAESYYAVRGFRAYIEI